MEKDPYKQAAKELNLTTEQAKQMEDQLKIAQEKFKTEVQQFTQLFNRQQLGTAFQYLLYFQTLASNYAQEFYLYQCDKTGLKTFSDDEEFLNNLLPFANANGTGSIYCIWDNGISKNLDEIPIVVLGDEGGLHIVTENILQLMQILTLDSEIGVDWDGVSFYTDFPGGSEHNQGYRTFIKAQFGLDPVQDPALVIQAAQKKYKASFDEWCSKFYTI
jgi:hypothetical protein